MSSNITNTIDYSVQKEINTIVSPKKKYVDKRTILHSGSSRIDIRSAKNNPEGIPRKRTSSIDKRSTKNIISTINSGTVKLFLNSFKL